MEKVFGVPAGLSGGWLNAPECWRELLPNAVLCWLLSGLVGPVLLEVHDATLAPAGPP